MLTDKDLLLAIDEEELGSEPAEEGEGKKKEEEEEEEWEEEKKDEPAA